jgi:hypothetical protein
MTVRFASTASSSMPGSPAWSRSSDTSYTPTETDLGPRLSAEFISALGLQSTPRCYQNNVSHSSRGPAHSANRVAAADSSTG